MGRAAVDYRFERLPSAFRYYPRAVFGRRAALVPEGRTVPRLRGQRRKRCARAGSHLARYRKVCGFGDDGSLPITYPHVLAMPLHIGAADASALRRPADGPDSCRQRDPPDPPVAGRRRLDRLRTWIEGHRDERPRPRIRALHGSRRTRPVRPGTRNPRCSRAAPAAAGRRRAARARRCVTKSRRRGFAGDDRHRGAALDRAPLRLAVRRPEPDTSRRPRRAAVRFRPRRCAWHVVHGAFARGTRRCRAGAAGARIHVDFKFPLFLP